MESAKGHGNLLHQSGKVLSWSAVAASATYLVAVGAWKLGEHEAKITYLKSKVAQVEQEQDDTRNKLSTALSASSARPDVAFKVQKEDSKKSREFRLPSDEELQKQFEENINAPSPYWRHMTDERLFEGMPSEPKNQSEVIDFLRARRSSLLVAMKEWYRQAEHSSTVPHDTGPMWVKAMEKLLKNGERWLHILTEKMGGDDGDNDVVIGNMTRRQARELGWRIEDERQMERSTLRGMPKDHHGALQFLQTKKAILKKDLNPEHFAVTPANARKQKAKNPPKPWEFPELVADYPTWLLLSMTIVESQIDALKRGSYFHGMYRPYLEAKK